VLIISCMAIDRMTVLLFIFTTHFTLLMGHEFAKCNIEQLN